MDPTLSHFSPLRDLPVEPCHCGQQVLAGLLHIGWPVALVVISAIAGITIVTCTAIEWAIHWLKTGGGK